MVVSSARFCIIRWLPRWRIATNPFPSRIRQTSSPERTRTLPNRNLNLRHENLTAETAGNFGWVGGLEEQRKCFYQIRSGLFYRGALAGDVEFRAESHKSLVFAFDDGGKA